jgi:hypothetical protein
MRTNVQKADELIRLNQYLLARAEQARGRARAMIAASSDARIQRCFRVSRPSLWADMTVAWAFAASRVNARPLSASAALHRERSLRYSRAALAISPAAYPGLTVSGPH